MRPFPSGLGSPSPSERLGFGEGRSWIFVVSSSLDIGCTNSPPEVTDPTLFIFPISHRLSVLQLPYSRHRLYHLGGKNPICHESRGPLDRGDAAAWMAQFELIETEF